MVTTLSSLQGYYARSAALWEIQAALKMRPIAGDLRLGYRFLDKLGPVLATPRDRKEVVASILRMREAGMKASTTGMTPTMDLKSGWGGLRDVEFLVQGLQLIHGPGNPVLFEGNTLLALDLLQTYEILTDGVVSQLKEDYLFLRRIEHYLQIYEDRQIHSLPKDPDELDALAKRVLGIHADGGALTKALEETFARINEAYVTYLLQGIVKSC
jgi:glutamate-ammonia-ligase adenylyltransferase